MARRGREGRSPRLGAPTVFENSPACAILKGLFGALPDRVQARPSPVLRDLGGGIMNHPVKLGSAAGVRSPATTDLTAFLKTVEPASAGLIPRRFFTESLILAQDERWRRA